MGTTIMHSGRQFAGGGSEVVANPSATPTNELEKIRIGDTVYDIPGTGVEANPSDTPTDHLESIKIGDETYDISGGGSYLEMEISNGSIKATYGETVEETDDILKDSTGRTIMNLLDDIADSVGLLGNSELLAPIIYSEEEREVGVWTDGKPLYQKTIYPTSQVSLNNTVWTTIPWNAEPTNIDHLVDSEITQNNQVPNTYSTIRFFWTDNHIKGASLSTEQFPVISIDTYTRVTFRYTKTTDTPGSGKYTTLGVPAVHYSTDEQVIGTWIDGKTLYQKTIFIHNESTVTSQSYSYDNDIPNCDMVITQESCIKLAGTSWVTGDAYTNTSQYRWDIHVNSNTKNIGIQCLSWGFTDAYVTLKYTKTTS